MRAIGRDRRYRLLRSIPRGDRRFRSERDAIQLAATPTTVGLVAPASDRPAVGLATGRCCAAGGLEGAVQSTWRHPLHGGDVRFGVSTLERWLALARRSPDPATLLATVPRADAGCSARSAPSWRRRSGRSTPASGMDHSAALRQSEVRSRMPGDAVLCHGAALLPCRRLVATARTGARSAARRAARRDARSAQLRGHARRRAVPSRWPPGSLKVLSRHGEWITPIALCVIDDCSRLICHLQWYAHENTECLVHCVHRPCSVGACRAPCTATTVRP